MQRGVQGPWSERRQQRRGDHVPRVPRRRGATSLGTRMAARLCPCLPSPRAAHLYPLNHMLLLLLANQVSLVQQDLVGKRHLFQR